MGFKKSSTGLSYVSVWPTEGDGPTFYSPDWSDPTTWYHNSVRQVDVACDETADLKVWQIPSWTADKFAVDASHAKISEEDALLDSGGNSYKISVKHNGVDQTEQDPHFGGNDGDYVFDYINGTITFHTAKTTGDTVTITYHLTDCTTKDGTASEFVIVPKAGKKLEIAKAEVQFSKDIVITDSVEYEAWGYVDVFAPHLLTTASPPGPYPPGTKIPLKSKVYKSMRDFYNDANGTYPELPALGGNGWRGMTQPTNCFPWLYQAMTEVSSQAGMEIRVRLTHDEPFQGEYATATFYCLSVDE